MTEWIRGAKAGVIAGIVWASTTITETALSPVSSNLYYVVGSLRVAWGLVLGIIFAIVAGRFMSTRSYRFKGAVFGLALCIVEVAGNLLPAYYGVALSEINLTVDIVSVLVFGYVLAFSYDKLASRKVEATSSPSVSMNSPLRQCP